MSTDFRAELQRLVEAHDEHGGKWPDHHEQALFQAVENARVAVEEYKRELHFARAALARYAQPVPVSERLPGPEDCDSEGRCWWLDRPRKNGPATWILRHPDDGLLIPFLAWLPHWALPVPTPANNTREENLDG